MRTYMMPAMDLPNVGQNKLSTMNLSPTFNHHGLYLEFTDVNGDPLSEADIVADISWISLFLKLKPNSPSRDKGKQIFLMKNIPPQPIFDLRNKYRESAKTGYTYAGVLYIPFESESLSKYILPYATVLGMADVESFHLHVQFANAVLTTVRVQVTVEVDKEAVRPLGEHVRFEAFDMSHAEATPEQVSELPYGEAGTYMAAYHVELGATGVLDEIEVRANGEMVHDPLTPSQNALMLHRDGKTPIVEYFHVDFARKGSLLPVGEFNDFYQKFFWSVAPNSYKIYTEIVYGVGTPNS